MSAPIYEPVMLTIGVSNPEKYTLLLNFCAENGFYVPPVVQNPFKQLQLDTMKRLPTEAYKNFCGPENLTPTGFTTMEDVYKFLNKYAVTHELVKPDSSIELPKMLRDVFNVDKSRFFPHEVVHLAARAFPS
jgi:hypothetical protein